MDEARQRAGDKGERLVRDELRKLKGRQIAGFIPTENLNFREKDFELDFLVLVPKIGLVVMEVKYWMGRIEASDAPHWRRGMSGESHKNASLQVLRASGLLLQALESVRCNRWPIRPVVVFAHPRGQIYRKTGLHAPQTDIILKSGISNWIQRNERPEVTYRFTQKDFELLRIALDVYVKMYSRTDEQAEPVWR